MVPGQRPGGALTGQGLLQEKMFGELFSGALHKNPAIAPGQLHKITFALGGFKRALRGFSVEAPKPHSGPFSGRFGSDSGGLPGCNSDFWSESSDFQPVTLTFGPKSESFH